MKSRRPLLAFAFTGLLLGSGFAATGQRDVTLHGVVFTKVRTGTDGFHIGRIDTETVVGGRACRAGWLHLHPDGTPAAFTAAHDIVLPHTTLPAGTWVTQDPAGVITVCALPRDTIVQGHLCRGTGGPKGVQVTFHPDGSLHRFFPAGPVVIDGVPCAPGLVSGMIELHPNGRLKSCRLAADHRIGGVKHRKGTRLTLPPEGHAQP